MSLAVKKRPAQTGADPALRTALRYCLDELRHNQSQYDLEQDPDLIEACIYGIGEDQEENKVKN